MRRMCLFASAAVMVFAIACSSGPAPTSPSRVAVGLPAGTQTGSTAQGSALFGAGVVDFARCLQGVAEAGCVAGGARMQTRAVGAAATSPGAPINLSTSSSGSTVTLTWSAPSSGDAVTTYLIEAGSGPGLANLANVTTNSTATSFSANGVGNGTYYVRVRAQNASGTRAASNESILVVGSTGCTSTPNAPTGFAIAVNGGTLTLTWSAPSSGCAPSSYLLQAGSSAGASDLANANVGAGTSYVASGVGAGTYFVRVRAVNAFGQSAASNEVVPTVGGTPPPSSVTGRWVGLAPDGMIAPAPLCQAEADLTLDLTQTESTVSGTATDRTRLTRCENNAGKTRPLTGTVGAGVVSFIIVSSGEGGNFNCSGTFTATRMTGNCTGSSELFRVTFAVNRQ